jgi:hypothetical protein
MKQSTNPRNNNKRDYDTLYLSPQPRLQITDKNDQQREKKTTRLDPAAKQLTN